MSTQTKNLGLTKAAGAEKYSLDVVNGNLDKVDEAIGELKEALGENSPIVTALEAIQSNLEAGTNTEEIAVINTNVETVKQNTETLKTTANGISAKVENINSNVSGNGTKLDTLANKADVISGQVQTVGNNVNAVKTDVASVKSSVDTANTNISSIKTTVDIQISRNGGSVQKRGIDIIQHHIRRFHTNPQLFQFSLGKGTWQTDTQRVGILVRVLDFQRTVRFCPLHTARTVFKHTNLILVPNFKNDRTICPSHIEHVDTIGIKHGTVFIHIDNRFIRIVHCCFLFNYHGIAPHHHTTSKRKRQSYQRTD